MAHFLRVWMIHTHDNIGWNQTFVLDRWPRGPFNMIFSTSTPFFIPMSGIEEREWMANFRFRFCRTRRNDSQVPNITIFGNKCPTILDFLVHWPHWGCVLGRKFQGTCRSPTRPPEQLVVPGCPMGNGLSYMASRLRECECILPDTRGPSLWIQVMSSPWHCCLCHGVGVEMRWIASRSQGRTACFLP